MNPENLQKVVERMIRAKWVAGISIVSPMKCRQDFTPLGFEKMQALAAAVNAEPDNKKFMASSILRSAMKDLSPGQRMSFDEYLEFFGLILEWARKPPPP